MKSKINRKAVTAVITVMCFFTVMWLSCDKSVTQPYTCSSLICKNGGYCLLDTTPGTNYRKPFCTCPPGYIGKDCGTAVTARYIGTWGTKQVIDWSDSLWYIGVISNYNVILAKTATNTTFFFNNFFNNQFYNYIICDINPTNPNHFTIDTLSGFHMYYDNYKMVSGYGDYYDNDSIIAHVYIRYKNRTSNLQQDSLTFHMSRQLY